MKPALGSGGRFANLSAALAKRPGVKNPGRKKYGEKKMSKWSSASRKRGEATAEKVGKRL